MVEPEASDLLDKMANPHPRLMRKAALAWKAASYSTHNNAYFHGILDAMVEATGYDIETVMNRVIAHAKSLGL